MSESVQLFQVVPGRLVRSRYERPAHERAIQWIAKAQAAATATWTEQDAIVWLRENDFVNVGKGEGVKNKADASSEEFYSVIGFREIDKGGIVVRPLSVWIMFIFGMDHRFRRVEYELWPFPCRPLQPLAPTPKRAENP